MKVWIGFVLAWPLAALGQGIGYTERGQASYYAPQFHGQPTASGQNYNKNALTCAHRTLPFGTKLKVTSLANKQSVEVMVNDRGPFIAGRVVDVSLAAAQQLGLLRAGVAPVEIEVIAVPQPGDVPFAVVSMPPENPPAARTSGAPAPEPIAKPAPLPKAEPEPEVADPNEPEVIIETAPADVVVKGPTKNQPKAQRLDFGQVYDQKGGIVVAEGYGVQLGAFSNQANAQKLAAQLGKKGFSQVYFLVSDDGSGGAIFKAIYGMYPVQQSAIDAAEELLNAGFSGFVVAYPEP